MLVGDLSMLKGDVKCYWKGFATFPSTKGSQEAIFLLLTPLTY